MARKPTELRPIMTRLPEALRVRLEREAEKKDRSMNSEIVYRLEWSFRAEQRSLVSAIVNATLPSKEPKWIEPEGGNAITFSPEIKAIMEKRIVAFIQSLPEREPLMQLTDDDVERLSDIVKRAKQAGPSPSIRKKGK